MKQVAKKTLHGNKSNYERMKVIARADATKRGCSVQEPVYLVIPEHYKIFKKKIDINDDTTDLLQRNMPDLYLN